MWQPLLSGLPLPGSRHARAHTHTHVCASAPSTSLPSSHRPPLPDTAATSSTGSLLPTPARPCPSPGSLFPSQARPCPSAALTPLGVDGPQAHCCLTAPLGTRPSRTIPVFPVHTCASAPLYSLFPLPRVFFSLPAPFLQGFARLLGLSMRPTQVALFHTRTCPLPSPSIYPS